MKALTHHFPPLASLLIILAAPALSAQQIPAVYPVQGFLTDNEGQPIDGELDIRFRLYDDDGEPVFQEIAAVPISQGAFFYYLGTTEALDAELFSQFDSLELGLKVGSDSEMTPRMKVGSVPFAARAAFADEANLAQHANSATTAVTAESATHAASADTAATAESATHAESAAHADSTAAVDGAITVYKVTNKNCAEPVNMLSFFQSCSPKQFDLDQCPSCPSGPPPAYIPGSRYRDCEGQCACTLLAITPVCSNEPAGKLIPPS